MEKRYVLSLVGIIFLALAGYVVYTYFPFFSQQNQSIPTLEISLGSSVDARLYKLKDEELVDITFIPEGSIVSRTRRHDIDMTLSAIMPNNEIGTLLILETPDGSEQASDQSSVKDGVALSADGTHIAYAQLNVPFGTTLHSDNVADWNIQVMNVATQEVQDLGVGFRPFFVSEDSQTLAYTSPEGIILHNLSSGERITLFEEREIIDTTRTAYVSPNGKYLGSYNPVTKTYTLFLITGEDFPYEANPLGEPRGAAFELIGLSDAYLYGITRNQETNMQTLWRYTYEALSGPLPEGELIYTFKAGEWPHQIIP